MIGRGRLPRALRVLVVSVSVFGCSTSFTFGVRPNADGLAMLERGVSTPEDVRRILGEPRGRGEARLAIGHATIWFYEYGEATSGQSHLKHLMVFLRDGLYDGYLRLDLDTRFEDKK
jgi:hypothetical protein